MQELECLHRVAWNDMQLESATKFVKFVIYILMCFGYNKKLKKTEV